MAKEKEFNAMFWGVVLGAIGGAAFTLLRTPRSGREIRGEITSQASRLTSRGQPPASYTWQPPSQPASPAQQQAADVAAAVQQQASAAAATASALQKQMASDARAAQQQASEVAADAVADEASAAADDVTAS